MFCYASNALSLVISSSYYLSKASLGSSLTLGLFFIAFARDAYLSVDRVSS